MSDAAAGRTHAAAGVQRLQSIDLIRAGAAIAVLTYHVWLYRLPNPSRPTRDDWAAEVFWELRLGLIAFLVLSGFLLLRPFVSAAREGKSIAVGRYLRRRFARIVPAYYAALAGTFLLLWWQKGEPGVRMPDGEYLPLFLVFGQNYSRETLLSFDPPTWTLAVQAAFYLLLPLVAMLLRRNVWMFLSLSLAVGIGWNWWAFETAAGPIARLALPALLPYFASGIALALVLDRRPATSIRARNAWAIGLGGASLVVLDALWHKEYPGSSAAAILRDLPAAIGFAMVTVGVMAMRRPRRSLLPLEAIGRWSYGVFLWHVPLIVWLRAVGLLPGSGLLAWAVVMALATAAGAFSWRLIELPSLKWSKRLR